MSDGINQQKTPWFIVATICLGTFMSTSSAGVVNTALPTLARVFETDLSAAKWMVSGFLITVAGLLPTIGRLSDIFGPARVYNLGFFIFVVGSALISFSNSLPIAVGLRVLQAVGSTMLVANNTAILSASFRREQRGRAIGLLSMAAAFGTLCGPAMGGLILQVTNWHWLFLINLPLGLLGGTMATIHLSPLSRLEQFKPEEHVDLPGALTFALSAFCLILCLSQAAQWGLDWRTVTLLGIGLGAGILFVRRQHLLPQPLLDIHLFRNRELSSAALASFLAFVVAYFTLLMVPFYLDRIPQLPPGQIGLLLTGYSIVLVICAPLGGWLSDRHGTPLLSKLGASGLAVGQLGIALLPTSPQLWQVIVPLMLQGIGMGLFTTPNNTRLMNTMPSDKLGTGGSIVAFVRVFGQATGATLGVVLFQWGAKGTGELSDAMFLIGHQVVFGVGFLLSVLITILSS